MSGGTRLLIKAERVDFEEMVSAVDRAGDEFVRLLCDLNPEDGSLPVPGLDWTVGEVAVHMLTVIRRGLGDRRRADSVPGLGELNDLCIEEVETRRPLEVADMLSADKDSFVELLRAVGPERAEESRVWLHSGITTNAPTSLSYVVFDLVVHGLDIARATGRSWHADPKAAAAALHAGMAALAPWVSADVLAGPAQRVEITFPGHTDAVVIELGSGSYRAVNLAGEELPEAIEVDPVELLFALAGRQTSSDPTVSRIAGWFDPI